MGQLVGYARVSSVGQSLDVQLDKLQECDKVFREKRSGKQTEIRPELLKAPEYVREGDTLIITRFDRGYIGFCDSRAGISVSAN